MGIPREFIELLLAKTDIVDLINIQVPLHKKSGNNYFARCPFHNEKSASFSVSQPKQFYYCFGCGAHGNAIDFLIQHDRLSFPEAVEALARHAGMEIPRTIHSAPIEEDNRISLYDLMPKIASYYYEQMRQSERAINYLKKRGLSGSIVQQFQLGYALAGWRYLVDQFGQTETDQKKLLDVGLIIKRNEGGYYDRFRDRIMFPIHDHRGRIIGFGGRILDNGEPKYLNSPETSLFQKGHALYGLHQALQANRQLKRILLVEGYMDVIALFQYDITYAVATLGTATTSHHLKRLIRYTSDLIFCFDGDQAGRTAAWRALQVLFPDMQDDLQIKFLFLPDNEDPDSLLRKEGKEKFEKRLETASPLSAFFFQTLSQQSDMNTMEGRARFAAIAMTHIKQLPTGILQSILINELSKRARVNLNQLKQQINPQKTPLLSVTVPAKSTLSSPLQLAMALLIQYPHLAHLIQCVPTQKLPLFQQLIQFIKQKDHVTTGTLIENWRGQPEEELITRLAILDHMIPTAGIQNEFLGTIRQLTALDYEDEINRLLAKAAQDGLSLEEKQILARYISDKKALTESNYAQ